MACREHLEKALKPQTGREAVAEAAHLHGELDNGLQRAATGTRFIFRGFLEPRTGTEAAAHVRGESERKMMDIRLLSAAREGNRNLLKSFLTGTEAEAHLGRLTSGGDGVLHIAAKFGHTDLVQDIKSLNLNVVVDVAANRRGETPLHCAAAAGSVNIIGLLLTMAGDHDNAAVRFLRERTSTGETCLHTAVQYGHDAVVKELIDKDPSLARIEDNDGVSPLYLATTLRTAEIVRLLAQGKYQEGDNKSAPYAGPEGKTALHAAVLLDKELSNVILEWNAGLASKVDKEGDTPLHLVASRGHVSVAKLLLQKDQSQSAAFQADKKGWLPIHVAAANGSLDIIKLLLQRFPMYEYSCSESGQTILHIAVENGTHNVVKYLCSGERFVGIFNTRDNRAGKTALHLAVENGQLSIFHELLGRKEVHLSIRDKEGRTPLDVALSSVPHSLQITQSVRRIYQDLQATGADFGTCRLDRLRVKVEKADKEKESEKISKSAGLVAVCAVLILNIAAAAPFNVAKKISNKENLAVLGAFVFFDVLAFVLSTTTTLCCTFAGLPIMDFESRLTWLYVGWVSFKCTVISILLVFMLGAYVVLAPVDHRIVILALVFPPIVVIPLFIETMVVWYQRKCTLWKRSASK